MPGGRQCPNHTERVSHVAVESDFFASSPPTHSTQLPQPRPPPPTSARTTSTAVDTSDTNDTTTAHNSPRLESKFSDISEIEKGIYKSLSKRDWVESDESRSPSSDPRSIRSMLHKHLLDPILTFISPKFKDKEIEAKFRREKWFMTKRTALLCSLFIAVQWILSSALMTYRASWMYGAYIGICGFFTLTLPFFVMFDGPLRTKILYQIALACTVWSWGIMITVEMDLCGDRGTYGADYISDKETQEICGNRTSTVAFMQFGVIFGIPTLAVIGLHQNRLLHIACATFWMVFSAGLLLQNPRTPPLFIRNLVIMEIYHILLAMIDHLRERTDRQLFSSQNQIRMQNIAMREAQAMEAKAQATKKSFVSYIFHEVRVPLNTALLALQNLDGENVFKDLDDDQAIMVNGLMGSLTMMEKVLNDVLSHSRMEQGTLVQAREPFDFHKSMHIVGLSYRSQAELSNVQFKLELDPRIEMVAPVFIGDEMRLRQITSNLVSNALKFTQAGGSVRLVTKLIHPAGSSSGGDAAAAEDGSSGMDDLSRPGAMHQLRRSLDSGLPSRRRPMNRSVSTPTASKSRSDRVVVRVEIHDTGVGIQEAELVDNNLFSPYVQTEIGRRQGGKGSGLGLALVMQIVKLSRGRLGVDSEVGKGSCFWFEMPYTLPSAADHLPKESRHMLLTKPSFLHVMGSPQAITPGLPSRRDSTASVDEVIITSNERRRSSDSHTSRRTSVEEAARYLDLPRTPRGHSGETLFHDIHGSQLRAIPSSPSAAEPVDPLDATAPPAPRPNNNVLAGCPPVTMETRRSMSVSSPPARRDFSPSQAPVEALTAVDLPSPPTESKLPSLSPTTPGPRVDRLPSDETEEVRTPPEISPKPLSSYQPLVSPLSSMSAVPLPKAEPGEPRRKSSGRSLNALVVDDDSLTRRLMSRMLFRLGHQVTVVDNGKKALDLILAQPDGFDVVFLDNQMPVMTGVEAVSALRDAGLDTYVVGCTGNALREDREEYLAAGANALIAKPVHQASILEQLGEAKRRSDAKVKAREEEK